MLNAKLDQLLYILVCVSILLEAEGSIINITYVHSAVAKGAVCLDGSPPAYHFDKGFGEGANSWLIHLEGGGWCGMREGCKSRSTDHIGSSKKMREYTFKGILSEKKESNPNFYNWNRIFVRYCDGSVYTGDVEKVDPVLKLHYRGARVFDAIMEELLAKGLKNASNAILSGCSAGGLASILHCDSFRALLSMSTKVKCVSDAGYFIHVNDFGSQQLENMFDNIVKLHGSAKNLPSSCTSKKKPGLCLFPQYVVPHIQTPLFIIHSVYDVFQLEKNLARTETDFSRDWGKCKNDPRQCSPSQNKTLKEFRSQFLNALTGLGNSSFRGMFINSCLTHCQTESQMRWFEDPASKLDNKALGEAVGDWFYDRKAFQQIDYKHEMPHLCGPQGPNGKD